MANYNSGYIYNDKYNSWYNSAPYRVMVYEYVNAEDVIQLAVIHIPFLDSVVGIEDINIQSSLQISDFGSLHQEITEILASLSLDDYGAADESDVIQLAVIHIPFLDSVVGIEDINIQSSLQISDFGSLHQEITEILASLSLDDYGAADESVVIYATIFSEDTTYSLEIINFATFNFLIDENGILIPLNLSVLMDSRKGMLPRTKERAENIPGRHGDINFGSKLQNRLLELHLAVPKEFDVVEREALIRSIAIYLDPTKGYKLMGFKDEIEKTYYVKYSGKIDLINHAKWFEFILPFKCNSPYAEATFESIHLGSGTINNEGNVECPLVITINGPLENPEIILGDTTLSYNGTIADGETLVIDTEKMEVKLNGINVLKNYTGGFPKLQLGTTQVSASNKVTFRWRSRWL